jgi:photosystem II PsbZ protein
MLFLFQLSVLALIAASFLLVIGVPVAFASPEGFSSSKGLVFSGLSLWAFLVFCVAILQSFVL